MRIELEATNNEERRVLEYLETNASDILMEKINAGEKTLKGFFGYAREEAKKIAVNGCACVDDEIVFGWAIHYFEEDKITEVKKGQPKKEPKTEKKVKIEAPKKIIKNKDKQVKEKISVGQISLFEMAFGGTK